MSKPRKRGRPTVDVDAILRLAAEGMNRTEIAKELGCYVGTATKHAELAGIPLADGRRRQDPEEEEVADSYGLTGGRWVVGRHGIRRWVKDVAS